jgi:hypothetical protein
MPKLTFTRHSGIYNDNRMGNTPCEDDILAEALCNVCILTRNPYSNLTSAYSQDYAQKPQRNCTFMNSA